MLTLIYYSPGILHEAWSRLCSQQIFINKRVNRSTVPKESNTVNCLERQSFPSLLLEVFYLECISGF